MCASAQRGTLPYLQQGVDGHIAVKGDTQPTVQVDCAPLHEILQAHLRPGEHVDYLSLDIEGNEVSAIAGTDWDAFPIGLLDVESAWSNEQLDMLLHDAGFWRVTDIGYIDDLYIRARPLFKFPCDNTSRKENWDYMASVGLSLKRTPASLKLSGHEVLYEDAHRV